MSEVIRDVLIKVRVEHDRASAGSALGKAKAEADAYTKAVSGGGDAASRAAEKSAAAFGRLEKVLSRIADDTSGIRGEAGRLSEAFRDFSAEAVRDIDRVIRKERELEATTARVGRNAAPVSVGGKPGGGFGLGAAAAGAAAFAGPVAAGAVASVALVAVAPGVLSGLNSTLKGIYIDVFGANEEVKRRYGFVGGAIGEVADTIAGGDPAQRALEEARRDVLREQIDLLTQQKGLMESLYAEQANAEREKLASLQKSIDVQQQIIDSERARLEASREAFGFLNADEQRSARDIAGKVAKGGIGSLTREELEFARQNPALTGPLREKAMANADAAGFADIVKTLGADAKLNAAQSRVEVLGNLKNEVEVKLTGFEKVADDIIKQLKPTLEAYQRDTLQHVTEEIERNRARTRALGLSG